MTLMKIFCKNLGKESDPSYYFGSRSGKLDRIRNTDFTLTGTGMSKNVFFYQT